MIKANGYKGEIKGEATDVLAEFTIICYELLEEIDPSILKECINIARRRQMEDTKDILRNLMTDNLAPDITSKLINLM